MNLRYRKRHIARHENAPTANHPANVLADPNGRIGASWVKPSHFRCKVPGIAPKGGSNNDIDYVLVLCGRLRELRHVSPLAGVRIAVAVRLHSITLSRAMPVTCPLLVVQPPELSC